MTDDQRIAAVEAALDGLTVEEAQFCREMATECGRSEEELAKYFRGFPLQNRKRISKWLQGAVWR